MNHYHSQSAKYTPKKTFNFDSWAHNWISLDYLFYFILYIYTYIYMCVWSTRPFLNNCCGFVEPFENTLKSFKYRDKGTFMWVSSEFHDWFCFFVFGKLLHYFFKTDCLHSNLFISHMKYKWRAQCLWARHWTLNYFQWSAAASCMAAAGVSMWVCLCEWEAFVKCFGFC